MTENEIRQDERKKVIAFMVWLHDFWLSDDEEYFEDLDPERFKVFWNKWHEQWLPAATQEHNGDCVDIPAACTRCHLENVQEYAGKLYNSVKD